MKKSHWKVMSQKELDIMRQIYLLNGKNLNKTSLRTGRGWSTVKRAVESNFALDFYKKGIKVSPKEFNDVEVQDVPAPEKNKTKTEFLMDEAMSLFQRSCENLQEIFAVYAREKAREELLVMETRALQAEKELRNLKNQEEKKEKKVGWVQHLKQKLS